MQDVDARPDDDAGHERDDSQFVTFQVDNELFAAPMAPVQEIIRVPELARVPLAPHSLLGLANLRGKVLPIVDLRRIFGLPDVPQTDATRALVINLGTPLGFVVDRVASVIGVEAAEIEPVATIRSSISTDLLTGVARVENDNLLMILDFARLIEREFASLEAGARLGLDLDGHARFGGDGSDDDADVDSGELHLVSFTVADEEYGADIAAVQEIVQMPARTVVVPNAPGHVLGLMTLRERLLPLVSLRALLGLYPADDTVNQRVLVLSLASGEAVGVVADSVDEVLRVPPALVEPMPAVLSKGGGIDEIGSICRLDGGKRIVSVIDTERMFASASMDAGMTERSTREAMMNGYDGAETEEDILEDEEQVVVFRLDDEEFGVPISAVQEIVRVPETLTHVPKAPKFVEGVINLRGAVLPVMDQRRRLGLAEAARNDRQRIMVYLLNGKRIGFIVDAVSEVLKIPRAAIEVSPELSGEQHRILGRVANLEKQNRMILLVDPSALVSAPEMDTLAKVA